MNMQDKQRQEMLGKALLFVIGPLFLIGSLVLVGTSGDTVSETVTILSYLVFMLALAAFAGGAYLWITSRQARR